MKRGREMLTKLSQKLELPLDIAAGVPHIEINGFGECSLDCHTGILEYEKHEIVVAVNIGVVTIQGCGLELRLMQKERLTVTGRDPRGLFSAEGRADVAARIFPCRVVPHPHHGRQPAVDPQRAGDAPRRVPGVSQDG